MEPGALSSYALVIETDTELGSTSGPPADVRTFLIADVRGYTRFTQEHGDEEAAELAARFAELTGKVVAAGGGQVLELRGDEALSVFSSARKALRAAVELQRRFRERNDGRPTFPLGIGIGLDSGEAVPVGEGYRGTALNRAARLCSLAGPGQILATETVVSLASKVDGIRFEPRRPVRLKGIDGPVRLIEVVPEEELPPVPQRPAPGLAARVRTWRVLLPLAVGSALVVTGLVLALIRISGGDDTLVVGNAVAAIDPAGGVLSYTQVGASPSNVAVGEGAVWVLNADDQTVSRIDPETRQVDKTFGTGQTPTDIAVGEGAVWVGNAPARAAHAQTQDISYTASVSRIDPQSSVVTRTLRLPVSRTPDYPPFGVLPGVSQLAVGDGVIWAINPDFTVSRIDAATGGLVANVPVRAGGAIAAGREGVWVVGDTAVSVTRIDPRTNRPGQTVEVGASFLSDIALGAGSVWVSAPDDGVVWRIEPRPKAITRTIPVGQGAATISFANGALWVANFLDDTVSRIDPATNAVTQTTTLPGTLQGIAAVDGRVWVSVVGTGPGVLPSSACSRIESGGREPDVLIASDLPLRGEAAPTTRSMSAAILFILRSHGFRAGEHRVGYQSCDDSTSQTGRFEFYKCGSNAKAYAAAKRLVGIIGTYNSGCATVELPIVNRAPAGPLAMISPANTYVGLTRAGPAAAPGHPKVFYPTGVKNYARVIAPDDLQGAAHALLAKQLGLRKPYVLEGGEEYGIALARTFITASRKIGIDIAGSGAWNPRARSYAGLADRIARSGADGIFLAGYLFFNGGEVVKALRARLGDDFVIMAGDAFLPVDELLKRAGRDALGMYVSTTFGALDPLTPAGRKFVRDFAPTQPEGSIDPFVLESAQAAEILLQAIARSDGTRASVLKQLRAIEVRDGILGSFSFDANGDITPSAIAIYRVTGETPPGTDLPSQLRGAVLDRVVSVPSELIP
jgi:branched-chain amino acid transport system substrate-binding protein